MVKEKTYKANAFFEDPNVILQSLEEKANLPSGDLVLEDSGKRVTDPDIPDDVLVYSYKIYSKKHGGIVGSFQRTPNPFGPYTHDEVLFFIRWLLLLREDKHLDYMLKPTFAGSGSITIAG